MPSRNPLFRSPFLTVPAVLVAVNLLCGFGLFHRKKYETPITKDTMQPDKVLFDRAINNIEHGNYLAARLTLNTLINTYDTSEYLAKAKLAIADSWFREGDAHGLAQAEIEYKDFILFYPNMEESAESQSKICDIHIKQMSKADRDSAEAQRAEDECRQVIVQFPNSKFRPEAEQKLRNVQEVLAEKEFNTAEYYYKKGSLPAAQGRFSYVTQQYPLFSAADQALWDEADAYHKMGDRFENQEADALTNIVKNYPASLHLEAAKNRLTEMKRPVPDGDPTAYARMKFNLDHETREGIFSKSKGLISGSPFMGAAAKQGDPVMAAVNPAVPVSVPLEAAGTIGQGASTAGATGVSDVGIKLNGNTSALDQKGDARLVAPGSVAASAAANAGAATAVGAAPKPTGSAAIPIEPETPAAQQTPLPTNHPYTKKQLDELKKAQDAAAKKAKKAADAAAKKPAKPASVAPAATPPGSATPTNVPASAQQ
jgi:outer membrane protein assembly factor BamD